MQRGPVSVEIGVKSMDVLVHLAEQAGAVVSAEQLLIECWRGTFYGDNPVHKAITELRKQLGDNVRSPTYIATIRKRGYRLLAPVVFPDNFAGMVTRSDPAWGHGSPFRGLEPFDARYTTVFFGRSSATAQILQSLRRQIDAGCAFVLCVGPSGCGKTSLIRAGVLPLLTQPGGFDGIAVCSVTEVSPIGESLCKALAHAMTAWTVRDRPVFMSSEIQGLAIELQADPEAVVGRLAAALQRLELTSTTYPTGVRFALVVDALEGLFANPLVSEHDKASFVRALDLFARCGHVLVMATCRNDFYPRVVELPVLIELKQGSGLYDVKPVTLGEISQMIRRPAQSAALTFARDAQTEELLDDVIRDAAGRNPEALPLLQYTLQELYARRSDAGVLSFEAYREIGGIEGALGTRAEAIFQQLDNEARSALPWLLQHLVNLHADDGGVTGRKVAWSSLGTEARQRLVQRLVDARLLVSELAFEQPMVSVAHEALLQHWPRVVDWIDENRAALQARARLAAVALRWKHEARRRDFLLPSGRLLDEALPLLENMAVSLADYEIAFIRISDRHARFAQRMRVLAVSLISVFAVMAIAAAVMAIRARQDADRRRAGAEGLVDFMLGNLSERLQPLGRLDLLDSVSTEALHYLTHAQPADMDRESSLHRAKALMQIGDIRLARADREQALVAFSQAMTLLQQLHIEAPKDADILAELGKANFWMGLIDFRKHDLQGAAVAWERYRVATLQRSVIQPGNPDAWLEMSYAYNNLGTLAAARNNYDEALADFRRSIELKRRVLQEQPANDSVAVELADSLSWVGSNLLHTGRLLAARDSYQQEFDALSKARVADPMAAVWRFRLANAHSHIAGLAMLTGNLAVAQEHYESARVILVDIIAKQPDNRSWQHSLAVLQIEMGGLWLAGSRPAQAQAILVQAIATMESLLRRDPSVRDWQLQLALGYRYLAVACLGTAHLAEARIHADRSVQIVEGIASKTADDNPVDRAAFAQSLIVRGDVELAARRIDVATQSWSRALELLARLAPDSRDPRMLEPWVRALVRLHRDEQAVPAIDRLSASGYRDAFMSVTASSTAARELVQ
nr:winged helix-turn-helix domain-containing protein [Rhodanobacter sp. MP1X3]